MGLKILDGLLVLYVLLIPAVCWGAGLLLWKKTPKRNHLVGWRTPIAMKSEENFQVINKYAGKIIFLFQFPVSLITVIGTGIWIYLKGDILVMVWALLIETVLIFVPMVWVARKIKYLVK